MAIHVNLLCLAGDGIGPEIMAATKDVVSAVADMEGLAVRFADMEIGFSALEKHGTTIPVDVIEAAREADGVILGPVSHNAYPLVSEGGLNPSGVLRKSLSLGANIRPAKSHPAVAGPLGMPVDLIVVRENLEGFYADRNMEQGPGEFMPVPGVALALRRITSENSRAIARAGFRIAAARPAKKVALIHKANVMRLSDGLFLDAAREVARDYPEVEVEEVLVDAAAALLVRDPSRFDVMVTTNMFGDILSDLASELAGGLGLAASLNHGAAHAVAQAQHGSAPDIAGQDRANPSSLIGSAAMLLDHLGHHGVAGRIHSALDIALAAPETRTTDLGGQLGTRAFADQITATIQA